MIVQDFAVNLRTIDDIVKRLDIQPLQVMVEAVILSLELDRDTNLGINFALLNGEGGQGLTVFGNGAELTANAGFTPANVINAAGGFVGDPAQGFPSPTNGFKYGFVNNRVTGFIRALETIGQINVLASPRVLVLNKQRAEIQLGQRLGYATSTQNLTSTVQQINFLNTGTLLRFRPFISNDGMIRMEIHPEKSTGSVVSNVPSSNTTEVTTNVMVPDGATIVIGGLIENDDDTEQQGTLGLSRLPVVGPLFRQKQQATTKRELVVMLTPRIWNPAGLQGNGLIPGTNCPPPMVGLASSVTSLPLTGPVAPLVPNAPRNAGDIVAPQTTSSAAETKPANSNALPALPIHMPGPSQASAGTPSGPASSARDARVSHVEARNDPSRRDPAVQRTSLSLVVNAPQSPPTTDPGYARHLVRRGESFVTISQRYYGSGRYAEAIWLANRGQVSAPNRLAVGMAVVLPALEDLDGTVVAPRLTAQVPPSPAKRDDQLQRSALAPTPAAANDPSRSRP